MQKKQETFKSKRKERMVRHLHFLVLGMVISHKNLHNRLDRQGNDRRKIWDGS